MDNISDLRIFTNSDAPLAGNAESPRDGVIGSPRDGVIGSPRDTEELALIGSVERAIRRETHGAIRELRVDATPRAIMILGECSTYYAKQLAQETASRFREGRCLVNEIAVSPSHPR